jgi:putative ABC transport system permease protein
MWVLATKAMLADRGKLAACLLGVSFAVLLVNLQGGLLIGLIKKASLLIDYGQADIWVGHKHMKNVELGTFIPTRWLQRVRKIEGVERADAYVIAMTEARMPDGRYETVEVIGGEAGSPLGQAWALLPGSGNAALRQPDGVIVDDCYDDQLGSPRVGDIREVNGRRARIVGKTHGIVGFTNQAYFFTTLDRARTRYAHVPPDQCSYFLVKARPGTDIRALCRRLQQEVPEAGVYDAPTYSWMCMEFWLLRTGIGISFGLATVLGLLVGLAVVAQTLYAAVAERSKEFGTLKALGATEGCVARFLLAQALGNAVLGSALGVAASQIMGRLMSTPKAPVEMTWQVAVLSVLLIVLVCLLAAWLPYWRLRRIDPASVLRG